MATPTQIYKFLLHFYRQTSRVGHKARFGEADKTWKGKLQWRGILEIYAKEFVQVDRCRVAKDFRRAEAEKQKQWPPWVVSTGEIRKVLFLKPPSPITPLVLSLICVNFYV